MEPYENLHEEIQHTIKTIHEMNASIAKHLAQDQPDKYAIEQFRYEKRKLVKQLPDMLLEMNINILVAA